RWGHWGYEHCLLTGPGTARPVVPDGTPCGFRDCADQRRHPCQQPAGTLQGVPPVGPPLPQGKQTGTVACASVAAVGLCADRRGRHAGGEHERLVPWSSIVGCWPAFLDSATTEIPCQGSGPAPRISLLERECRAGPVLFPDAC